MTIAKKRTLKFLNDAPNVRVSNETDATSVVLEIWNLQVRYDPIALLPNDSRDLAIQAGEYRFDFNYMRIDANGTMKATVESSLGTFGPKSGTSTQGRTGTVAILAKV